MFSSLKEELNKIRTDIEDDVDIFDEDTELDEDLDMDIFDEDLDLDILDEEDEYNTIVGSDQTFDNEEIPLGGDIGDDDYTDADEEEENDN